MNKKHIYISLLLVATLLLVACPEPTKDKGKTAPPTVSKLLGTLEKAVGIPAITLEAKKEKQKTIQDLLSGLKKAAPKYKHKPETKDELIVLIKAEVWGQGTGGAKEWKADLNNIDTSEVRDMAYLFSSKQPEGHGLQDFNGDISGWNVSSVTNMASMFSGASAFNGDISGWNVSSVTDMSYMFFGAATFNQNLAAWAQHFVAIQPTTSTDMYTGSMAPLPTWHSIAKLKTVVEATKPDQKAIKALIQKITKDNPDYKHTPKTKDDLAVLIKAEMWRQGTGGAQEWKADLNNIDTSRITDMSHLFSDYGDEGYELEDFNGDISGWNVSSVTNMASMFRGTWEFNGDISGWKVGSVTNMASMFRRAWAFNGDISGWNVSSVTNMASMFKGARKFDGDISGWNVSSVTNMASMFRGAWAFDQDLNAWDKHLKNADGTYKKIGIVDIFEYTFNLKYNPPAWLAELKKIP